MAYFVVRYDVNGMAEDPDNPGHAIPYTDETVVPPELLDSFPDPDVALAKAGELNSTAGGEEIEIMLANGKPYKGPRYIYRIARG